MKRLITICAALAVAILSNSALADMAPANPVEGSSWSQLWENSFVQVDRAEFKVEGSTFQTVALSSFNTTDWAMCCSNSQFAIAEGLALNSKPQYNMNFETLISQPLTVYEVYWLGNTKVGADKCVWDGSGVFSGWTVDWTWSGWDQKLDCSVVPLPGAVLLGILGMGVAGLKLRKYV